MPLDLYVFKSRDITGEREKNQSVEEVTGNYLYKSHVVEPWLNLIPSFRTKYTDDMNVETSPQLTTVVYTSTLTPTPSKWTRVLSLCVGQEGVLCPYWPLHLLYCNL